MRIFWFNTDNQEDRLTLLHDTNLLTPSKPLLFPPEIISKIINYLPRFSLPAVAQISRVWYNNAMPILYRQLYICTYPHWLQLARTFSDPNFQFGHVVRSLVLQPSPRLISARLISYLNQEVVPNDDTLQPGTRGYVRLGRVNYELHGLEGIDQEETENYTQLDDTRKEYEWLTLVTTSQVNSILQHTTAIQYLNLSGCENVTDEVLFTLAKYKQVPLKGLWTSLLRELTPNGLLALINSEKTIGKSEMRHLDISYNIGMTHHTLRQALQWWGPSLTHVRLDTIYQVSDHTVAAIASNCPQLRLLHLTRCWHITNSSLHILSQRCQKLKYVSLAFTSQVTEEGIKYLVQLLPELKWVDITGCGIIPLFKPMILQGFANSRKQKRFLPIEFKDGTVNLI